MSSMRSDEKRLSTFGTALHKARLANNMTLEDLSEASGFAVGHLSMLESGKRNTKLLTICYLCEALGVRPKDLLKDL